MLLLALAGGAAAGQPIPSCPAPVIAALATTAAQPPGQALTSRCLPWSGQPGTQIGVAAFALPGAVGSGRRITVAVATLDRRQRLLASSRFVIQENAATWFDESSPDTLDIDPGPYELAPGRPAFGVVVYDDDAPRCADGSVDNFLYLYLPEGGRLRPVLQDFPLTYARVRQGDPCGDHPEDVVNDQADFSLGLAASRHHGLRDLRFSAVTHPLGHRLAATVRYDGQVYPLGDFPDRIFRQWP